MFRYVYVAIRLQSQPEKNKFANIGCLNGEHFLAKLKANAKLLENVKLVTDNGRGHNVICDLSEASGGTNAGPSPLELALMALAGCGVIIYADVCKNSKIDPGNIEIAVEAEKT